MKYTESALHVLTALTYKGIGKAWIVKNIPNNVPEEIVVSLLNQSLKTVKTTLDEFKQRKIQIEQQINNNADHIDGVIAIGDTNFPQHRGNVQNSQKPVALFFKGDISLLNNKNVAVIGLLQPDSTTEFAERKVVDMLVQEGVTIVSGLANGCDAIAHEQTLQSKGKTIAILPSPLHNILPKGNLGLAKDIFRNGGLLITEYLNDAGSKIAFNSRYQERDRLQALFSDVIILAASYAKNDVGNDSGARLAMEYARQYTIPRAVMYDELTNKDNAKYDLNRQIINETSETIVIHDKDCGPTLRKMLSQISMVKDDGFQSVLF